MFDRFTDRARKVMPGGVPSSFQLNDPWPVYIERGQGALVWDVDGEEYVAIQSNRVLMAWMKEDLHAQLGREPTEKELAARDFGFKQNQAKSERL